MEVETKESPRAEYQRRLEDRRVRAARLARRERLIGNGRVVVFLLGLGMIYPAMGMHLFFAWWLMAPVVVFSVLLFLHEQVTRDWRRAGQAAAYYRDGLARLDGAWKGRGRPGARFLDEKHPYAADLDLFGPGSLFELLCTARTRTGEETLAGWLLAPAAAEEIRQRQAAVAELRPLLDLREDLALLGADVPVGVDLDAVAAWGAAPPPFPPPTGGGGWGWGAGRAGSPSPLASRRCSSWPAGPPRCSICSIPIVFWGRSSSGRGPSHSSSRWPSKAPSSGRC